MKTEESRWVRAFLFGILAEIATIASIIITVLIYKQFIGRGLSDVEYGKFGVRAGGIVGLTMGTLYVFLLAWPIVRSVSKHRMIHGAVVALGAMTLQLAGSLGGHGGLPMAYAYSVVLKLVAGVAAGWLAWRVPLRATAA
ncbi:MAG: hypothetical protein H0U64_04370 [Gemmatimonadaceae bacterium]|nr:hypothetical protein [Gemmatimonadaceae bacterium]